MSVFDRKYWIVDTMGNYYSTDNQGTLVMVEDGKEPEEFDILAANDKVCNSGSSKSLRTVPVGERVMAKKKKLVTKTAENAESTQAQGNDEAQEFTMDDIDLVRLARELSFVGSNIHQYQKILRDQQRAVEEEICDIMHFIELYQRDEEKSLKLVEQIEECRKRRREIKDNDYTADIFSRMFCIGGVGTALRDMNKRLENMEIREYVPRRLPQLFIGAEKQSDTQQIEAVHEIEDHTVEVEMTDSISEEVQPEEYQEDHMDYERRDTVFDGKQINWEAMVVQQVEFFENAEQHIVNLQLDVEELEVKIEELMLQCEDARYNVAQGYKMFKQLKELRLERKEKLAELDKVTLIAECFHCGEMAEAYRYCADSMNISADMIEMTVVEVPELETMSEAV